MEKAFTGMDIDEWELLCNKNSRPIVPDPVFPSPAMEEQVLGYSTAAQPNFRAAEAEPNGEVIEEAVVEDEQALFSDSEKQSEENEGEADDGQTTGFEAMADEASDEKSESISLTEEDEEEVGEMVEYNGPDSKLKSGGKVFRLRNLLRSAGLAAATFSVFILQKSIPKNQKIQLRISKNEKAKQLFQSPPASRAHSSFTGHYDEWY